MNLDIHRIDVEKNDDLDNVATQISNALTRHVLVHVRYDETHSARLRTFYDKVSDAVGVCIASDEDLASGEITGNKWIDIRYDPYIQDRYRTSSNAQPLHTDESYNAHEDDRIAFMYCENQATKGGETIFIPAAYLDNLMRNNNDELYHFCCNEHVTFSKADRNFTRPIITHDGFGPRLNYNYHCLTRDADETTKKRIEELHAWLNEHVVPQAHGITLKTGEAVLWNDDRLLHGRRAYEATHAGDRLLWKTTLEPHAPYCGSL